MVKNTEQQNMKDKSDLVTIQLDKLAEAVESFSKSVESISVKTSSKTLANFLGYGQNNSKK